MRLRTTRPIVEIGRPARAGLRRGGGITAMDERCIGFVEWYDRATGTGWIVPMGREAPVRVYRDDIEGDCRSLSVDQQVSFTIELGEGRFVARRVRP